MHLDYHSTDRTSLNVINVALARGMTARKANGKAKGKGKGLVRDWQKEMVMAKRRTAYDLQSRFFINCGRPAVALLHLQPSPGSSNWPRHRRARNI
jgi:hypothetical protein